MYKFLLLQWKMKKIDESYLKSMVDKNVITPQEYETIINTKQV